MLRQQFWRVVALVAPALGACTTSAVDQVELARDGGSLADTGDVRDRVDTYDGTATAHDVEGGRDVSADAFTSSNDAPADGGADVHAPESSSVEGDDGSPDATAKSDAGVCIGCAAYGPSSTLGSVPESLLELSGIAASARYPGRFYAHNDSGDTARVFGFTGAFADLTELRLDNAVAEDWEDIALGPCELEQCIFIADTGDNKLSRSEYAIYRIDEPESLGSGSRKLTVPFVRYPFRYADGPHNTEAMLVHPVTGRIYLVSKDASGGQVFELPTPLSAEHIAIAAPSKVIAQLPAGAITGGSFHPCGDRLLLRTNDAVFELLSSGTAGGEAVFQRPPTSLPVAPEQQGEAVSYLSDGLGYVTSGETVSATENATLNKVGCR